MKIINKRGFTLTEILAVIAVLGIIVAIATSTIISTVIKSKKEKFITDAKMILKTAEDLYTEADYRNDLGALGNKLGTDYFSISMDTLESYIDNIEQNGYSGHVIINVNNNKSYINLISDDYYLAKTMNCISSKKNRCAYSYSALTADIVKDNNGYTPQLVLGYLY